MQIEYSLTRLSLFQASAWDPLYQKNKEGKSAARFCHQVAAWVPDMFCNFYLVKHHKIANTSATTEAREKISTDLKSVEY
jgi:hypothetical protein